MAGDRHERVPLLSAEPELARLIPGSDVRLAGRHLTVEVVRLPAGPLPAELLARDPAATFGAIVLDGLLLRQVTVMEHSAVQLVGPGDVFALQPAEGLLLPRTTFITCSGGCRLGLIDDQCLTAIRRWPQVAAFLFRRAGEQVERASLQHAIGQLPRVHDRILATFWHLAERHGRVTPSGIHLPVTLTHRMLGLLVGARRPTVSLALGELEADGAIGRRADRTWMILRTPPHAEVPESLPGGSPTVEPAPAPWEPAPSPPGWAEEARQGLAARLERLGQAKAARAGRLAAGKRGERARPAG